jgi:predicted SAM-dependent methyltransferase
MKRYEYLNLGCGNDFIKGWLNVGLFDNKKKFPYGKVVNIKGADVLNWDITKGLTLQGESVKCIYASHFIDHLFLTEGFDFLRNCFYLLKPGGVARITCPDLGLWIDRYNANDMEFFDKYKETFIEGNYPLNTKGQIFMYALYGWHHKWGYDYESLKDIMRRVGFPEVSRKEYNQSVIGNITEIEPSQPERIMETLYVEAVK